MTACLWQYFWQPPRPASPSPALAPTCEQLLRGGGGGGVSAVAAPARARGPARTTLNFARNFPSNQSENLLEWPYGRCQSHVVIGS